MFCVHKTEWATCITAVEDSRPITPPWTQASLLGGSWVGRSRRKTAQQLSSKLRYPRGKCDVSRAHLIIIDTVYIDTVYILFSVDITVLVTYFLARINCLFEQHSKESSPPVFRRGSCGFLSAWDLVDFSCLESSRNWVFEGHTLFFFVPHFSLYRFFYEPGI